MRIALCDDENSINEEMRSLITRYAGERDYEIECELFSGGEQLLERERFDLYFLDYLMHGMNGVETAARLNEKFGHAVTVCFLTNYESAAQQIINSRIYADGFLKKPVDEKELFEKLDGFFSRSYFNRIVLRCGAGFYTVYPRDIIYAEAMTKNTLLHCVDSEREFPVLLRDFEEKYLSTELFFRIHRSYIVNMLFVRSSDSRKVTLKDGTELPLKRSKDFQKAYDNFNYRVNLDYF